MIRVVLAFLVAPITPMAPFILLNLVVNGSFEGAGPFLVMGVLYAYPAMLLVGVPLYIHAEAKGTFTLARAVKAASLTGAIVGLIVPMSFISSSAVAPLLGAAPFVGLIGALIGAAVGFIFWQIAGGHTGRLRDKTHVE